ncbi:RNA-processing protein, HAT helix, partial [Cynara cardunculus var. scolymus]
MEETLVTPSEPPPLPSDGDLMDVATEAHNPNNSQSASNSDSGSDSESDDEAQAALELQNLEAELSTNPANYDAHVQYIKALRKQGDIDKLRLAREAMSELFPLAPAMWQQWTNDEISLISTSGDLFERALIACGLHVAEGSKLWEAYKSYEEAVLNSMDTMDFESREKQVQRIRNIFHRHLSIPHRDLMSTLLTYKAWEAEHGNTLDVSSSSTEGISANVASAYQKAIEMLSMRADFEEKIAYLKFEQSCGDPARVKSLYERAITEFPISSDLWIDYTHYLNKTLKADKTLRDIFNRATRNCPWVGELWVQFMLYLERCRCSEKELSDYVDIFLTRVDGLRRRILFAKELDDGLDYALIRDTFQRACDYLSPQLKNTYSLLQIHRYWARLESSIGNDITAARGVWESLLKNSGSMLEAWQGYISMETEMGHINEARSLYKRCYSKRFSGTGSE